jgi:hypothetical protein
LCLKGLWVSWCLCGFGHFVSCLSIGIFIGECWFTVTSLVEIE